MARRKASDPGPSLFPFLSVLAAVMGTLILIIAGMSQLAIASPKQGVDLWAFDPGKKTPIFVECRQHGLRIYPDDPLSGKHKWVAREEIRSGDNAWSELTRRLSNGSTHYLMLLVREDGVRTYEQVRDSINGESIDLGYEPLFGSGDVRFRYRQGAPSVEPSEEGDRDAEVER